MNFFLRRQDFICTFSTHNLCIFKSGVKFDKTNQRYKFPRMTLPSFDHKLGQIHPGYHETILEEGESCQLGPNLSTWNSKFAESTKLLPMQARKLNTHLKLESAEFSDFEHRRRRIPFSYTHRSRASGSISRVLLVEL